MFEMPLNDRPVHLKVPELFNSELQCSCVPNRSWLLLQVTWKQSNYRIWAVDVSVLGRHFTCPIAKEENWRQFSVMKLFLPHWTSSAKMQEDWVLLSWLSSPTAWPLWGEPEDEAYSWGHCPSVSWTSGRLKLAREGKACPEEDGDEWLDRQAYDCHFVRAPKEQKPCPLSIRLKLARKYCCWVRKANVAAKPGCNDWHAEFLCPLIQVLLWVVLLSQLKWENKWR